MQDNLLKRQEPVCWPGSTHLDSGVLEQGPAAVEAKQALADSCGVDGAAEKRCIGVALQGPRH